MAKRYGILTQAVQPTTHMQAFVVLNDPAPSCRWKREPWQYVVGMQSLGDEIQDAVDCSR